MMNDMSPVIIPKSDQINADDLIAGPIIITITGVKITPGTDQPVSIYFEGDNGKPYKCCKSMAKVLVNCWGRDANKYIGRSLELYRDPKVTWGGMAVGGIRIAKMSHIDAITTMMLTESKKARKPFTVQPLVMEKQAPPAWPPDPLAGELGWQWMEALRRALNDAKSQGEAERIGGHPRVADAMADPDTPVEAKRKITAMLAGAYAKLAAPAGDEWNDHDDVRIVGEEKLGAG